jgi:putative hydrolase of the HAD superfamily
MKAVLFDLGHTLINYHNDWKGPERQAVEAVSNLVLERSSNGAKKEDVTSNLLGLLARARQVKTTEFLEVPLESVLNNCFTYFSVEEEEDLMQGSLEIFYDVLLERRDLVPGTLEMLQVLRDEGYKIGLVSDVAWGLPSYFPLRDMKYFGLDDYFDDMVFSTDVGLRKPNPRIFKIALYNVGARAEESVFVGNNLQCDIKGALGVGMTAILKSSDFYTHDESIVPTYKIDDWPEFEDILRTL